MINEKLRKLFGLGLLFSSKLGGLVVALFFVPIYNHYMSNEAFGFVTLFLTLQSLVLLLDCGVTIILSRHTALNVCKKNKISNNQWYNTEVFLTILYLLFGFVFFIFKWLGVNWLSLISYTDLLMIIVALWATVLQNICLTVLLAGKYFSLSSVLVIFGNVLKAGGSALIVKYFSPTIGAYVATQALLGISLLFVTRFFCNYFLFFKDVKRKIDFNGIKKIIHEGRALVIFNISAAVLLNLDKIIVSHNISLIALAPYFLASSLCITPISALSGPVMQFFQPGLTKAIFNDSPNVIKTLRVYISTLCVSTLLPSYILWVYRDSLIALWLGNTELVNIVADYTKILLPGIAIGGLGYISYVVLIAIEDFKFQSFLSLSMTAIVVILVVFFSMRQDIRSICYVYAFYHSLSTLLTWARCYYLPRTQKYALETAKMLFIIMIALAVLCVFFNLIINRI